MTSSTECNLNSESLLNNIIALLQDAQGTDYIEESRRLISDAICELKNCKEFEQIKQIKKEIIDELGEDADVDDYPPEDCYKMIGQIASILGFYDNLQEDKIE